jgi:thiamine kinase-like enzyme
MSVYIDRFDEDLRIIAGNLPPFVPLDLLDWMMGETRELEGLARELPAFADLAGSPTHGDLWPNNILVMESGQWYIIDWDDLSLGDPALEYSILLGPLWRNGVLSESEIFRLLPEDEDLRERFRLCHRAYILDAIIDTLADWVESEFAPEHQEEVRGEKERQHREALALYRTMY